MRRLSLKLWITMKQDSYQIMAPGSTIFIKNVRAWKTDFVYFPYDRAFPEYGESKASDSVCCIDVLEHIEMLFLNDVLNNLKGIVIRAGFHDPYRTGPQDAVGRQKCPSYSGAFFIVASASLRTF
jgi:hypothetical protein